MAEKAAALAVYDLKKNKEEEEEGLGSTEGDDSDGGKKDQAVSESLQIIPNLKKLRRAEDRVKQNDMKTNVPQLRAKVDRHERRDAEEDSDDDRGNDDSSSSKDSEEGQYLRDLEQIFGHQAHGPSDERNGETWLSDINLDSKHMQWDGLIEYMAMDIIQSADYEAADEEVTQRLPTCQWFQNTHEINDDNSNYSRSDNSDRMSGSDDDINVLKRSATIDRQLWST